MSIVVRVRNNDVNTALKILKRKVNDEGILKDLKKHEYHLSKAQKKRLKHKEALKRFNKTKRLEEQFSEGKINSVMKKMKKTQN